VWLALTSPNVSATRETGLPRSVPLIVGQRAASASRHDVEAAILFPAFVRWPTS
jgi:hypothetical protein